MCAERRDWAKNCWYFPLIFPHLPRSDGCPGTRGAGAAQRAVQRGRHAVNRGVNRLYARVAQHGRDVGQRDVVALFAMCVRPVGVHEAVGFARLLAKFVLLNRGKEIGNVFLEARDCACFHNEA